MAYDGELSTRDVLTKARDILVERGRCKGQPFNEQGQVCTMSALALASGGEYPAAWTLVSRDVIVALCPDMQVCLFNNMSDDETVIARFNEAIAHAV